MDSISLLGVLSLLAYFSGAVNGQCDLQAVSACMPQGQPSTENQCAMFTTLQTCLEPFRAACESDSTFQTMTSAFNQLGAICGGSGSSGGSNGQCDLAAVGKCMEGAQMPSPDTKDLQAACASLNEVKACLERYESDCASVQMFQQSKGAIAAVAPFCAGGSACNPMKCFTDAGLDPTGMGNLTCDIIPQVKPCITKLSTVCQGNAVYPSIVQGIQKGEKACSQACDFQSCNIDYTFPRGVPSKTEYDTGCKSMTNAITCVKTKCPGNKAVESMTMGFNKFCKDNSLQTGLTTYETCLGSATINQDCEKHLSPNMQDESEAQECERIAMYSMCAKKAVTKCNNEGAEVFASETARKIITMKSKREGGIQCSTSGAPSTLPALWALMSAAVVTLAAIL